MNPLSKTLSRPSLQAADKPTLQRAQSQPALSVTREPLTAADGEPQDLTGPTNLMSEPEPGEVNVALTVLPPLTQTQAEPFVLERAAERLAPEPRPDANVVQETPTAPAPLPNLTAMMNGIRVQTELALFFAEMQGVLSKAVTDHGLPANTFQGLDQLFTQARDTCRKLVERDSIELLGYAVCLDDDAEHIDRLARQAQGGTALPSDGELAREISKIPDATQRDQVAAAASRARDVVDGRSTTGRSANAKELLARFHQEEQPGDAALPTANAMGFSRKADSSPSNEVDCDPLAEVLADMKGDPRYSGQFEDTEESELAGQAPHPVEPFEPQQSAQGDRSELLPPTITPAPVTAARSPIQEAHKELAAALAAKPFNLSGVNAARAKLVKLEKGEPSESGSTADAADESDEGNPGESTGLHGAEVSLQDKIDGNLDLKTPRGEPPLEDALRRMAEMQKFFANQADQYAAETRELQLSIAAHNKSIEQTQEQIDANQASIDANERKTAAIARKMQEDLAKKVSPLKPAAESERGFGARFKRAFGHR